MFIIYDNNLIDMNRGDCRSVPIFINRGSKLYPVRYRLQEYADKLVFYLTYTQEPFEEALLVKELTSENLDENGDAVFEFNPEDTLRLKSGVYSYEVKLFHTNYNKTLDIYTVIPKRRFTILD